MVVLLQNYEKQRKRRGHSYISYIIKLVDLLIPETKTIWVTIFYR